MPSNRLEAAIRAGCDFHYAGEACTYPKCSCSLVPEIAKAVLRAFLSLPPSDEEVEAVAAIFLSRVSAPESAIYDAAMAALQDARAALQASTEYRMKEIGE